MSVRWYACRVCGGSTAGEDSYVVCSDCLKHYEQRPRATFRDYDEVAQAPISPEVEARLRKLLDW
jgi:hypothetical protein